MFTLKSPLYKVALIMILAVLVLSVPLSSAAAASAFPVAPQPNKSCQVTTRTPGHAASAPGSAFNPNGQAGSVYAGQQPQNSKNPKSVAQYDVACFNQTTKHKK